MKSKKEGTPKFILFVIFLFTVIVVAGFSFVYKSIDRLTGEVITNTQNIEALKANLGDVSGLMKSSTISSDDPIALVIEGKKVEKKVSMSDKPFCHFDGELTDIMQFEENLTFANWDFDKYDLKNGTPLDNEITLGNYMLKGQYIYLTAKQGGQLKRIRGFIENIDKEGKVTQLTIASKYFDIFACPDRIR